LHIFPLEFLQPYKARPETTASAARRLVAGALGLAPRMSKEQRDQERKVLKEAKGKRRHDVSISEASFKNDNPLVILTLGKIKLLPEEKRQGVVMVILLF
jgi:hypothetical protein